MQSVRGRIVDRRTYQRPRLDEAGKETGFETRKDMISRSHVSHQHLVWKHGWNDATSMERTAELEQLEQYALNSMGSLAGRTRWLGGTFVVEEMPEASFNCTFQASRDPMDIRELFWLSLLGCGTGFTVESGLMVGYHRLAELSIIESRRSADEKGKPETEAIVEGDTYTIRVGDSARGWADGLYYLLDPPAAARCLHKIVLDFSEIRGPGKRLRGFGWICNGSGPLVKAMEAIYFILCRKGGSFLDEVDCLDINNWVGTVLSTRRTAEIALCRRHAPGFAQFAAAKKNRALQRQRNQSNNSVMYYAPPSVRELKGLVGSCFDGSDLGLMHMVEAHRRAPWCEGTNPCAEILLPSGGVCNLVTVNGTAFFHKRDYHGLERCVRYFARANYRQTCVDLTKSGMLREHWHHNNSVLRLCGTSLTGVVMLDQWLSDYQIKRLRDSAVFAARMMAEEMGLPYPKAVTTIKPEGTISLTFGDTEWGEVPPGIHLPVARQHYQWINFSRWDALVPELQKAGYQSMKHPTEPEGVLVKFPVVYDFEHPGFDENGYNIEPAVSQLTRVSRWNRLWCDHNVSCTIYLSPNEVDEVAQWISDHWSDGSFVSLSFLPRTNPYTKASDFGAAYLPQEPAPRDEVLKYQSQLGTVVFPEETAQVDLDLEGCPGGACPAR